ncbi:MAG: site-specific DNA-methyltransferase, partial [Aquificaceae bacterium]|nr:site-specific DNA-methyltransferase [Aquificaceae bacterium]
SNLTQEEKEKAYKELMDAIEEVKKGIIKDFRMKIRGVHAEPFGGQEGGRMHHLRKKGFTIIKMKGESIKRDVIECSVETIKGRKHSAIYPRKLVAELIKLLSKEGDLVLDPFAGSGTTLLVAKELKRRSIFGTHIIIKGVIPTIKYYLRLVRDVSLFVNKYVDLLKRDESVSREHKEVWIELCSQ